MIITNIGFRWCKLLKLNFFIKDALFSYLFFKEEILIMFALWKNIS